MFNLFGQFMFPVCIGTVWAVTICYSLMLSGEK
jgi:hypothetical protein